MILRGCTAHADEKKCTTNLHKRWLGRTEEVYTLPRPGVKPEPASLYYSVPRIGRQTTSSYLWKDISASANQTGLSHALGTSQRQRCHVVHYENSVLFYFYLVIQFFFLFFFFLSLGKLGPLSAGQASNDKVALPTITLIPNVSGIFLTEF